MKREIEFRGQRADNKEWVYGYYGRSKIASPSAMFLGKGDVFIEKSFIFNELLAEEVIPETVGQYVGIKDKHGKKVYEGDIVKHRYFNHEVVFGEYGEEPHTTIGFFTKQNQALFVGEEDDFWYGGIDSLHEIEVLGNVFDNPELLNKIEYKGESDNETNKD